MSHISVSTFQAARDKTLTFLKTEFSGLQAGQASPALLEGLSITAYGSTQPLKNIASVSVDGPQCLMISPWDKGLLAVIEKAITDDPNLGLNPMNDGAGIRLNIPPLTTERRQDLIKVIAKMGEEAKVTIRQLRHTALDQIKKDDISEDEQKSAEKDLQKQVDTANKEIESSVKIKQETLLKV